MSDDFCLIHGYAAMASDRGPIPYCRFCSLGGISALSDREIDEWLLMMERLFGKEFLEGDDEPPLPPRSDDRREAP